MLPSRGDKATVTRSQRGLWWAHLRTSHMHCLPSFQFLPAMPFPAEYRLHMHAGWLRTYRTWTPRARIDAVSVVGDAVANGAPESRTGFRSTEDSGCCACSCDVGLSGYLSWTP
jgi:hypothetical protein